MLSCLHEFFVALLWCFTNSVVFDTCLCSECSRFDHRYYKRSWAGFIAFLSAVGYENKPCATVYHFGRKHFSLLSSYQLGRTFLRLQKIQCYNIHEHKYEYNIKKRYVSAIEKHLWVSVTRLICFLLAKKKLLFHSFVFYHSWTSVLKTRVEACRSFCTFKERSTFYFSWQYQGNVNQTGVENN